MTESFELGDKVMLLAQPLKRVAVIYREGEGFEARTGRRKVWRHDDSYSGPAKGIVVGKRTLVDGETEWDEDYGYIFLPRRRVGAYLVAVDLRRNPLHVLTNDLARSAQ